MYKDNLLRVLHDNFSSGFYDSLIENIYHKSESGFEEFLFDYSQITFKVIISVCGVSLYFFDDIQDEYIQLCRVK